MPGTGGLRGEVLRLYRDLLRVAREKDRVSASGGLAETQALVRTRFRVDAGAASPRDFQKIEFLLRRGWRQLEVLRSSAGAGVVRGTS